VRLKISTARMVFVSCILVLCTSYTTYAHEQDTINAYIALVAPLSGPLSEFGWSMLRAGRMRLDEDEDRGLRNAIAVKLLALDDKGNAAEALQLTRTVGDNQSVVAVIGHLTTTCTLAALPVYNASQLIHISPIATGEDLEHITAPFTFRTILSEGSQAMSLADYIHRKTDVKKVAVLYENTPFGNLLRDSFIRKGEDKGLSAETIGVAGNSFADVSEATKRVLAMKAGAVFLAARPELAAAIVRELPQGIDRPLVFGTYRLVSEEFLQLSGTSSQGILAAHPCAWSSDFKRGMAVKRRYETEFKHTMDWVAVQTYDAFDLLLWAIERAGAHAPSIRSTLLDIDSRTRARPGLAGPIYFNASGSLAREVSVAVYTGSEWVLRDD
jgi:branched-chain amino acid transport system substrate-binding protein